MANLSSRVPPNVFFEIDDFESDWDFSEPFDFVFGRNLGGTVRDFPQLFSRTMNNLNNGGWVEFVDFAAEVCSDDDSRDRAPNLVEWENLLNEASARFGKPLNTGPRLKEWMARAGFRNVREEVYKVSLATCDINSAYLDQDSGARRHISVNNFPIVQVPMNPWPKDRKLKEIGRYHQANMVESLEAYSLALFTRVFGWTTQEVIAFLAGVRGEIVDRSIHVYAKFYFVYGQRLYD